MIKIIKKSIMKNYLFIKSINNVNSIIKKYSEHSNIHIWNYTDINIEHIINKEIYIYCTNLSDFNNCLKKNIIPHITLLGDNIFNNDFNDYMNNEHNYEIFWFPSKENILNINKFLELPFIHYANIVIAFNPFIQNDISYPEFYKFLKNINQKYKNPLFNKELSLLKNEIFNNDNIAIIDDVEYKVILGLYGDYYIKAFNEEHNNKGILRDNKCIVCEYSEYCIIRGLGILKQEQSIKDCVSIKLMNT